MINAPILYINGNHPEGALHLFFSHIYRMTSVHIDVMRVMGIGFRYRKHFRRDILVDLLICRRWCV